ncbi:hypothetical protein [Methanobrevibacter sp.]
MSYSNDVYKTRRKQIESFYTKDKTDRPKPIGEVKTKYPFKSKVKYNSVKDQLQKVETNENGEPKQVTGKDQYPKSQLENYQRPYYSPKLLNWEADLVFFDNNRINYLFIININTRYLYVAYISSKNKDEMINAFMNLFNSPSDNVQCPDGLRINGLRFDGESALNSKVMNQFFIKHNINVYSNKSPYINRNRIVDRVIRTIRTAFDNLNLRSDIGLAKHREYMRDIVAMYNNSVHSSTGLKPIEMTFEQEYEYIKNREIELKEQLAKIKNKKLLNYQPGDPLLVYLPQSKSKTFQKKRINYSTPAQFIRYENHNVLCLIEGKSILVPIYYTKRA